MIKIHDVSTDEVIEREMTKEELKSFKDLETAGIAKSEAEEAKAAEKAALLAKLGITQDEAKLLLS
jgi:hypothetical protein